MRKPLLIQIVGPYRAETINGVRENIERAREAMIEILKRGHYVICPHTMTAFLDGLVPDEHFLRQAERLLECVDAIYVLDGFNTSIGSMAEFGLAANIGLETFQFLDDIPDLRKAKR